MPTAASKSAVCSASKRTSSAASAPPRPRLRRVRRERCWRRARAVRRASASSTRTATRCRVSSPSTRASAAASSWDERGLTSHSHRPHWPLRRSFVGWVGARQAEGLSSEAHASLLPCKWGAWASLDTRFAAVSLRPTLQNLSDVLRPSGLWLAVRLLLLVELEPFAPTLQCVLIALFVFEGLLLVLDGLVEVPRFGIGP